MRPTQGQTAIFEGKDALPARLAPATLAIEQVNVAANFVAGHPFTFSTVNLTTTGMERIVLTTQSGFADMPPTGGDLGELLHKADLLGLGSPISSYREYTLGEASGRNASVFSSSSSPASMAGAGASASSVF